MLAHEDLLSSRYVLVGRVYSTLARRGPGKGGPVPNFPLDLVRPMPWIIWLGSLARMAILMTSMYINVQNRGNNFLRFRPLGRFQYWFVWSVQSLEGLC